MEEIRQDEYFSEERKEQKSKEAATIILLVEIEHKLSSAEKDQYSGFLKLDFFTKADFEQLDDFYEKTWDKLTENGKSQMSHRVWEGVRKGEYSFDELPENVRKKEAERLYEQLVGTERIPASLARIPQQDRADFIREYEAGNEKAVTEVLSYESFSMNVSTHSSKDGPLRDPSLTVKREGEVSKSQESELRESNDASDSLSMAGVVLADAPQVTRPVVRDGSSSPLTERG